MNLQEKQDKWYDFIEKFCNNNNYSLITKKQELINNQSQIEYICPLHGKYITKVTSILQGKRCYKCSRQIALQKRWNNNLLQRQDDYYDRLLKKSKENGYILLSTKNVIEDNNTYIEFVCPKHGVHKMRISNYLNNKKCPKCHTEKASIKYRLNADEVEKRISEMGGKLLNKNEYINQSVKNLEIVCSECGEVFVTSLQRYNCHGGQVCSKCANLESKGERAIRHYLEENYILFEQEKWFSDCRDINPLPFDFYLPTYNTCIEYDGEQHYKDRGYKTGLFSDSLEYTKKHDEIKSNYCKKNKIELIRIPYWKLNKIDTILKEQLHKDIV